MDPSALAPNSHPDSGAIHRAKSELVRRFASVGGCSARPEDFARVLPDLPEPQVQEALHQLVDEGAAEIDCLSDGSVIFVFPRQ